MYSVLRTRIRIKVISWIQIRICINLQMTSQNVWNMEYRMSLYEHFFKGLGLFLEARIRIKVMRIRNIVRYVPVSKVRFKKIYLRRLPSKITMETGFLKKNLTTDLAMPRRRNWKRNLTSPSCEVVLGL
jgi:hypothetical protein